MKTEEFLELLIEYKTKGLHFPKFVDIAKDNGVSPAAIQKNVNSLVKKGILIKKGIGKYELKINIDDMRKDFLLKRIEHLEKQYYYYKQENIKLDEANIELEKSNEELRKSLSFKQDQNNIMDAIIKAQENRIKDLEDKLLKITEKKPRYKKLFIS